MSEILCYVGGDPVEVEYDCAGMEHVSWTGEYTVDGDGSPRCYGPSHCSPDPLDYLGNAGYQGNWWGIATHNQESWGDPIKQSEQYAYPGLYVSTTAYIYPKFYWYDPRHYVNSELVCFAVIPSTVRNATVGICKGCRARITDAKSNRKLDCVIADIGPSDHLGEGSIAAAVYFGLSGDPKTGGSSDITRFLWECWPGVPAEGFTLQT